MDKIKKDILNSLFNIGIIYEAPILNRTMLYSFDSINISIEDTKEYILENNKNNMSDKEINELSYWYKTEFDRIKKETIEKENEKYYNYRNKKNKKRSKR